jgi:hypothetical protein
MPPVPVRPPVPAMGASMGTPASEQSPVPATHLSFEQQPPVQVLPAQHMSPGVPHLAQTAFVPVLHA